MKTFFFVVILAILTIPACKNADNSENTTKSDTTIKDATNTQVKTDTIITIPLDTGCITGTFYHNSTVALVVNPRQLILKRDGSGQDIRNLKDIRPITWTLEKGKLKVRSAKEKKDSPGEEAYVNCKTYEITVFGELYSKTKPQ